ncbi:MAG: CinA family protein [Oryzihumus sp.]
MSEGGVVGPEVYAVCADLVGRLTGRGLTVATAESLTGGLVAGALTDVPGSSLVLRGGVVAYSVEVKASVLGVDAGLLASRGAVDAGVAEQMACAARERLGATYGLATTGVAGPEPSEGKAVGTVFVAVAGPRTTRVQALSLTGSRAEIRRRSVAAVLDLLAQEMLDEDELSARPGGGGGRAGEDAPPPAG